MLRRFSLDVEADTAAAPDPLGNAAITAECVRRFTLTVNDNGEPVFRIVDAPTIEVSGAGLGALRDMVELANAHGDGNTFTEQEIKRAVDLLYALGYGKVCGDMGDDEIRDMMINVGGWVQWLWDNCHLEPDA